MSDVPSIEKKINDFEVDDAQPTSESLLYKIAANNSFLVDRTNEDDTTLTSIEARTGAQGSVSAEGVVVPFNTLTTMSTVTITPSTNRVFLNVSGWLTGSFYELYLYQESTPIFSLIKLDNALSGDTFSPLNSLNFVRVGTTPGVGVTFSVRIFVPGNPSIVRYWRASIGAVEV